jgi:glycosyltransferase involved in cell wall biosynthesis
MFSVVVWEFCELIVFTVIITANAIHTELLEATVDVELAQLPNGVGERNEMNDLTDQPRKQRIALAIIYGGGDNAGLQRCIESAAPWVDGLYIAYNGSDGNLNFNLTQLLVDQFDNFRIKQFTWEDDFAKARNQSFSMVPKEKFDWILWLDHDDSLLEGENIQAMLQSLDSETQGVFLKYEYGYDPDNQKPIVVQWRERLLRTDGKFRWNYPIHEVCHGAPGTQYARKTEVVVRHHRTTGAEDRPTRERNRRILAKARREDPDQPRYDFYFANEIYAEADYNARNGSTEPDEFLAAIELYKEFIKRSTWDDDAYVANHRIAECYRALGEHNAAIDAELQGIKLFPAWPDSYLGVAQSFLEEGDMPKAVHWATLCMDVASQPDTTQAIEPLNATYMPLLIRGLALRDLKQFDESLEDLQRARTIHPNPVVDGEIMRLRARKNEEYANPDEQASNLRKQTFGSHKERSICFLTRPSFEVWHPQQEAQYGAGGAETCIMQLAPRFVADGWRVAVFGTPGEFRGIDDNGVEWWNSADFTPTEEFTVLVSSRAPEVFDTQLNAEQTYLWMHDVNVAEHMFGAWGPRWEQTTKVIALTDWHKNHLHRLYGIPLEQQVVIPNGIDPDRFMHPWVKSSMSGVDSGPLFAYSSSPDRGLDVVLRMWSNIRNEFPNAELHVFYGWEAIDKIMAMQSNPFLREFKAATERQVELLGGEEGGIYWWGRIPQAALAQKLALMDYWLYPTYFLETFCITALEMQMAGVIPITSNVGALQETVGVPDLRVSGHPNNFSFQASYLDKVLGVVHAPPQAKEFYQKLGLDHASQFTWDDAYGDWELLIRSNSLVGGLA